jgi:hypothetical protein
VLKGEDILLLLKLAGNPGRDWTVRALEVETTIPRSVVQRALERLADAGLVGRDSRRVNLSQAEEFLVHGLRYVFPGSLEGETRGIETAWAAKPLSDRIAASDRLPPVWPHAQGQVRGLALKPLHPAAINAAIQDARLREQLALVDALRVGDARIRGVAAELLSERLGQAVS